MLPINLHTHFVNQVLFIHLYTLSIPHTWVHHHHHKLHSLLSTLVSDLVAASCSHGLVMSHLINTPTTDSSYPPEWLYGFYFNLFCLTVFCCSSFVSFLATCGLSWFPLNFWAHIKITHSILAYHIIQYSIHRIIKIFYNETEKQHITRQLNRTKLKLK